MTVMRNLRALAMVCMCIGAWVIYGAGVLTALVVDSLRSGEWRGLGEL